MTAVQKLLDQISDPSTKAAHSELCFRHARDAANKATAVAPFAVTPTEALTLERLGITTSPFATTSHTHSADKILENDCMQIIGHYLPSDPVTFIQLKRSKLHLLKRGPDRDFLVNYCHEPKDVLRYGLLNPNSCPPVSTNWAFLSDTLHFMSTRQLANLFLQNNQLCLLFATLVLPIEALHRLPSLFPDVYKLEYYDKHFAYMPGGHGGGAYVHSYETLKWLSTGQIGTHISKHLPVGQMDYLTLEKVETKAAHHIMLIQRRRAQVAWPLPEVWVFQASDYVKLPPIFYPEKANVQGTYPHNLIKRLQAYCFSVKAVSLRDIFAKLRQVIETNDLQRYSMADLIRLANYLLFTTGMQQVSDYESFLTKGFLARLSANIRMRVRELVQGITGQASYTALLSVADVIPVHFTTRPICRPTQGADWFQPPQEHEKPLPTPPLSQQASPEDLDLLAEFEEMQRTGQNQPGAGSSHEESSTTELDDGQHVNNMETPEAATTSAGKETGPELTHKLNPGTAMDPDAPIIEDTDDEESLTLDENDFAEYDSLLEEVAQQQPAAAEATTSPNRGLVLEKRTPTPSEPKGCTTQRIACTCGLALDVWRKNLTKFIPAGPGDPAKSRECWFYSRNGEAYSYTGHRHESRGWPNTLDALLKETGADPDEYQHCLVQRYHPGARIPHHKDNESCYPRGHKILTINQEGLGEFTISCKQGGAQFSLDTGSYFTMPPFMQDSHTHAVHATTERVSLTFRQTSITQGGSTVAPPPRPSGPHKPSGPHHHPSKPVREPTISKAPESATPAPHPPATPPAGGANSIDTQAEGQTHATRSEFDQRTTTILKLHGFTAMCEQSDGTNPIKPVFFNDKVASLKLASYAKHSPTQQVMANMAKDLHRSFYAYKVDNKRATAYMSDIKNNLTGLVLPKLDRDKLSAWVSLCEVCVKTVRLLVIHGAGGAGKSRALQETMRALGDSVNDINVVVPTVNLVTDWKKKMPEVDPKRFMTFEKACEREGREIVIFDDYGKLPAGYIDAYLAIKPTVEMVILTGDQRQSTYHNQNKDAQTANLPANTTHFSHYCDYYINATHRQPRRLANPIMVHAERQLGGAVKQASIIPDTATVLVPSFKTQTTLSDLGRHALTYSGCQGLTIPHVSIVLDNDTPLCSNEVLYTAFSRASETITFINTHSDNPEFLAKLDCTPYLKTLISGVREEEDAGKDERPEEPEVREPLVKTHIPVANEPIQLEQKIEAMEDKDTRELWVHDEKTNLMQTQNPVIQLFPHQQAKDEALFKRTIEERIRTASPEENMKSIASTINGGDLLFEAYAQFMKVPKEPESFDRRLWLHCAQLAMRTYLSKPKTNLQQGAARQDPDFPANAIALFNKSQWVKKLEKVGFKFKAGQTISAFKQSTVLLTTTMALYLRKKREAHQPDNVFIMCEKTPDQFNTFVVNKWDFSRQSYTSDYSQYDQSQDATFLNFELRKARHFGIPEEVVQFYKFIKTHAKTFVGNLAVMRLSGEGPTFDANTECNIAYDALRFQLDDSVMACYAGDDLVRDKVCPERPGWRYSEPLFKLIAKPLATNKPDFCGWRLTPYGIVKSPIQLYQSLKLAIALGKMEEVKRSYALDYMFAFKLGDRLYDVFDEEELEKHQRVTRTMIKAGVKPPPSGSHMPVFHVTSDRLIKNPHYKEMSDETSDRVLLVAPIIHDDYVPTSFN